MKAAFSIIGVLLGIALGAWLYISRQAPSPQPDVLERIEAETAQVEAVAAEEESLPEGEDAPAEPDQEVPQLEVVMDESAAAAPVEPTPEEEPEPE